MKKYSDHQDDYSLGDVEKMLTVLDATDRGDYIAVGVSLKTCGYSQKMWDYWSEHYTKGDNFSQRENNRQWKRFQIGDAREEFTSLVHKVIHHNGEQHLHVVDPLLPDRGPRRAFPMPEPQDDETSPPARRVGDPPAVDYHVDAPLEDKTVAWFAQRGIGLKVLQEMNIKTTEHYIPGLAKKTRAIAFPYFRSNTVVNVKYRGPQKHFCMLKDRERPLYNLEGLTEAGTILVEGEMDVLALKEAELDNVVSPPNGAGSLDCFSLPEDEKRIQAVKIWYLGGDMDEAGIKMRQDALRRLGRERCRLITWPDGCKDANETLMTHGAAVVRQCVADAKDYPVEGLVDATALIRQFAVSLGEPPRLGVSTGWANLDGHYSVRTGELTVVTGRPGHGKSSWLNALMVNLAANHGWRFGLFSPEYKYPCAHLQRLVEIWTDAPLHQRHGGYSWDCLGKDEALQHATVLAQDHFHWMMFREGRTIHLKRLLKAARTLVFRHGIKGLVIDPWNHVERHRRDPERDTDFVNWGLKKIQAFAAEHDVHVWVIAHPAKMYRDTKSGKYPIPTLYDIAGSAHWYNRTDNGICVWSEPKDDKACTVVQVQKVRFDEIGRPGVACFAFDPRSRRYHPIEAPAEETTT